MNNYNKHYIKIDHLNNNIIKGFSNAFEDPVESDICICEEGQRHFELNGVVNASLQDEKGCCLYQWHNGQLYIKTDQELEYEHSILPEPPKTELETIKSDQAILMKDNLELGGYI